VAIAGKPVRWWEEVGEALDASRGKPLPIGVRGKDGEREVTLTPVTRSVENLLGDEERMGDVGVSPGYAPALAAVSRTDSPAWKAGLRTGDVITSMAGRPIVRREEIDAVLAGRGGAVDVAFRSGAKVMRARLNLGRPLSDGAAAASAAGVEDPELFISSVEKHAPAGRGGLRAATTSSRSTESPFPAGSSSRTRCEGRGTFSR
jgi:S1-C subfamily serine protease